MAPRCLCVPIRPNRLLEMPTSAAAFLLDQVTGSAGFTMLRRRPGGDSVTRSIRAAWHADETVGGHCQREAVVHTGEAAHLDLRDAAMVVAQPNASSINLRFRWLVA